MKYEIRIHISYFTARHRSSFSTPQPSKSKNGTAGFGFLTDAYYSVGSPTPLSNPFINNNLHVLKSAVFSF
jgi:hypothetical protein